MAIGVTVLATCIVVGQWLTASVAYNYFARFFNEDELFAYDSVLTQAVYSEDEIK